MRKALFGNGSVKDLCVFVLAMGCLVNAAHAGKMRYQINLSYVEGLNDLADLYEDNWELEQLDDGYDFASADIFVWPVGLSFSPFYQWDNGLRAGIGVGPLVLMFGDVEHFEVPLSVRAGYTVNPSDPVSFYVFGGPSYHAAGGDYVDSSDLGFVVGAGVELIKKDNLSFGIEASYDSAEVKIDDIRRGGTEGIKTTEFSVGLFILFQ